MSLKIKRFQNPERREWKGILQRPSLNLENLEETVATVFKEVRERGDEALREYTLKFDGVELDSLQVPEKELQVAGERLSKELKEAIARAKRSLWPSMSLQRSCTTAEPTDWSARAAPSTPAG